MAIFNKINTIAPKVLWYFGFLLCPVTIFSFFGQYGWFFDIFSHFRILFFTYFALCLLLSIKRSPTLCAIWGIFALLNFIPILALYIPEAAIDQKHPKILMMTLNLEAITNHHFDKTVKCIESFNPDIISLQELDDKFASYLKEKLPQYSYNKLLPAPGYSGVGLLSKYPIERTNVYNFGINFPLIASTVKTPLGKILILVVHPMPPITPLFWQNQSIFADGVAQICRATGGSIILAGDLNATAFSYPYI